MQQSLNRDLQHLSLNFLEHPKKSHVQSATLVAGRPLKAKNFVGIFSPSHSSDTSGGCVEQAAS